MFIWVVSMKLLGMTVSTEGPHFPEIPGKRRRVGAEGRESSKRINPGSLAVRHALLKLVFTYFYFMHIHAHKIHMHKQPSSCMAV